MVTISIAVRDTGIGMEPETLSRIFNSFEQADNSTTRKYGGTGLGLTICRRLCHLMGGTIRVESALDKGSTFFVELPFLVPVQQNSPAKEPPDQDAGSDSRSLKVLVAEDNALNAATIVALLKKIGHQSDVATNGQEALAIWSKGVFDVILMDIQMPVMDGELALSVIREQEQKTGGHIPVIALTAYALKGDRERFLAEGFDGYIAKPIVMHDLKEELRRTAVKSQILEKQAAAQQGEIWNSTVS